MDDHRDEGTGPAHRPGVAKRRAGPDPRDRGRAGQRHGQGHAVRAGRGVGRPGAGRRRGGRGAHQGPRVLGARPGEVLEAGWRRPQGPGGRGRGGTAPGPGRPALWPARHAHRPGRAHPVPGHVDQVRPGRGRRRSRTGRNRARPGRGPAPQVGLHAHLAGRNIRRDGPLRPVRGGCPGDPPGGRDPPARRGAARLQPLAARPGGVAPPRCRGNPGADPADRGAQEDLVVAGRGGVPGRSGPTASTGWGTACWPWSTCAGPGRTRRTPRR